MAPSRHFATATIRLPSSNSPTTHVHSPDPKLIGCDLTWAGVPPVVSTKAFMASMCSDAVGLGQPVDIYENVVGVAAGEHSRPVGLVPPVEVEFIHGLEVADYLIVRHPGGSFWVTLP